MDLTTILIGLAVAAAGVFIFVFWLKIRSFVVAFNFITKLLTNFARSIYNLIMPILKWIWNFLITSIKAVGAFLNKCWVFFLKNSRTIIVITLVIGIVAVIVYFAWKWIEANIVTNDLNLDLASLPEETQKKLKALFNTPYAQNINVVYNSQNYVCKITEVFSGAKSVGVVLTSNDKVVEIYFTYREFMNISGIGKPPETLSVPVRSFSGGVVANSKSTGLAITQTLGAFEVNTLNQPTVSKFVDRSGKVVS